MALPQPIATSLVVYGLIGVAGVLIVSILGLTGKLSKDDVGYVLLSFVLLVISISYGIISCSNMSSSDLMQCWK